MPPLTAASGASRSLMEQPRTPVQREARDGVKHLLKLEGGPGLADDLVHRLELERLYLQGLEPGKRVDQERPHVHGEGDRCEQKKDDDGAGKPWGIKVRNDEPDGRKERDKEEYPLPSRTLEGENLPAHGKNIVARPRVGRQGGRTRRGAPRPRSSFMMPVTLALFFAYEVE
jgi:hypothetical protein